MARHRDSYRDRLRKKMLKEVEAERDIKSPAFGVDHERILITVTEFAKRLGSSADTVHRNRRRGHYAAGVMVRVDVGLPGERWMVHWPKYLEKHTKEQQDPHSDSRKH